jgi:hypothetical protein
MLDRDSRVQFYMEKDNEIVRNAQSFVGFDYIRIPSFQDKAKLTLIFTGDSVTFFSTEENSLHNYSMIDGLFGIGLEAGAFFSCKSYNMIACTSIERIYQQIIAKNATNLYRNGKLNMQIGINLSSESALDLPAQVEDKSQIQWAERYSTMTRINHHLQMYNLQVCNVSIFGEYSSSWDAVIDTGSACLGLPTEFFTNLMAWIPSNCSFRSNRKTICYLPESFNDTNSLPVLSFALEDSRENTLHIPLKDLLLPVKLDRTDGLYKRRWCIAELSSMQSPSIARDGFQKIIIGFQALKSFYTVLDWAESRSGLLKLNSSDSNFNNVNFGCVRRNQCQENQKYDLHSNSCTKNVCSLYLFRLDSNRNCKIVSFQFYSSYD